MLLLVASQVIQTFAGTRSVAVVIISTILLDIGMQATQVSLTVKIFSMAPEARARLNALLILSAYIGQVTGTAVGTKLFVEGGYELSSGVRIAFGCLGLLVLVARGPDVNRKTWAGWEGRMELRKRTEVVVVVVVDGTEKGLEQGLKAGNGESKHAAEAG
ncbi:hypothetical protein C8F01DRAFT_1136213 [Mycena amicta]|nr:hypothetical protein C8F01DRAFT_1136213 [Mycena amicta]